MLARLSLLLCVACSDTCWINWLALGANWLVSLKRWTVEKLPQWEEQYAGLGVYSAEFNRTVDLEVGAGGRGGCWLAERVRAGVPSSMLTCPVSRR